MEWDREQPEVRVERHHQEQPETRTERYLCMAGMLAAFLAGDQVVLRIVRDPDGVQTLRFLGLAALVWLFLYLLWLLVNLQTVRYTLAGDQLILRQGWRWAVIPLSGGVQVVRWRNRWAWYGTAHRELGVGEFDFFPPLWLGRGQSVWVLLWPDENGERRAAAFRPSPELLAMIKAWIREREGLVG